MQHADNIPHRFVVLTTQRTGSTWMMDRISSVPGAQGHRELFYDEPRREPPKGLCNDFERYVEIGSRFGNGRRPWSVFGYLDRLYYRPGAVGFKLMYSQLRNYPEILWYIVRRRLTVVHLVRSNHLDVILSRDLKNRTGTAHITDNEGEHQPDEIALNPGSIAKRVKRLDRKQGFFRGLLRVLPVPVHEVSYESLCEDDNAFLEVCDFLGIPGEREDRSRTRLRKIQRSAHSKLISNYGEVKSALMLAGYEHLLQ